MRVSQGVDARVDTALRINADHARATAFLIHDGVVPANEGRGYVLRKIMRRAMRNGRLAGASGAYFSDLVGFVADFMHSAYPELEESKSRVARIVKDEESRYASTFQVAERFFQDEAKNAVNGVLPGAAAFRLYDTFGLALDEQEEMAREFGLTIDRENFTAEMEKQRTRARASWKGAEKAQVADVYKRWRASSSSAAKRSKLLSKSERSSSKKSPSSWLNPARLSWCFPQTPFYAESGGQVADTGLLLTSDTHERVAVVEGIYKATPTVMVHKVRVLRPIRKGDRLTAVVDKPLRGATMRNHTATHLLHAALRQVLGAHVKQAGSVVEPGRLRFDFNHYTALTPDELREVELLVNRQILANTEVSTEVMDLEQALSTGAMALFGEKYGDNVRVVTVPGFQP